MSWFDKVKSGLINLTLVGQVPPPPPDDPASIERQAKWADALATDRLPDFVETRLKDAASGKVPWISTMTPIELSLTRSHGIRPLAMVSGTCWHNFGYSWTQGHAEGWHRALSRLREGAYACGANAIVDVKMRTIRSFFIDSMDFTLVGTAVRIDGLPPSDPPIVATVPAMEFVRLLEVGIVPTGIAIGAHFEWLKPRTQMLSGLMSSRYNRPLSELGEFWETVRRVALRDLYRDARAQGNGVLARIHYGEIDEVEGSDENAPPRYWGRHIVIGTVIDYGKSVSNTDFDIRAVVDMRDTLSPLGGARRHGNNVYSTSDEEDEAI
jgi:uncharacterized protein YbjQ (UPF0145 family)